MEKKKINKQGMYYTIVAFLMIAGCLLNIFSIEVAQKISIKQQQIVSVGTILFSLGSILGVIEIKTHRNE